MVLPKAEFKVDDDFVVGTVPVDSVEESEVRKLALDRRRRSLKKGMSEKGKGMGVIAFSSSPIERLPKSADKQDSLSQYSG